MSRLPIVLALALAGCSDDDSPTPATFAEHCGAAAPVRLLELQPDQARLSTRRHGERLYHEIYRLEPNGKPVYPLSGRELWSTGLCGESPRHIGDDLSVNGLSTDRWPELLLACQDDTSIVVLDPESAAPPHLLFPGAPCNGTWTDHGLFTYVPGEDNSITLLLYPYPDDPRRQTSEPIVLVDAIASGQVVFARDNIAHILNNDAELLRIDLADLGTTVEQTNVRDYVYSDDRRYLLWQDAAITGGPPGQPSGSLILRDNQTGISVGLGQSSVWLFANTAWLAGDRLALWQTGRTRIYDLPGLTFIDLPAGGQIRWQLDDGRLLVVNEERGDWLSLLDPADGNLTPLFSRRGQLIGPPGDAVTVLDTPCCTNDPAPREGKVWSVPIDGSPATLLADRASIRALRISLTRMLTSVDREDDSTSTLLQIDTDTRQERRIDDHVLGWSPDFGDPALLTYIIRDGDRSGIWQVRLPPP